LLLAHRALFDCSLPLAAMFAGLPPSSSELSERKALFRHLLLQIGGANIENPPPPSSLAEERTPSALMHRCNQTPERAIDPGSRADDWRTNERNTLFRSAREDDNVGFPSAIRASGASHRTLRCQRSMGRV